MMRLFMLICSTMVRWDLKIGQPPSGPTRLMRVVRQSVVKTRSISRSTADFFDGLDIQVTDGSTRQVYFSPIHISACGDSCPQSLMHRLSYLTTSSWRALAFVAPNWTLEKSFGTLFPITIRKFERVL